VRCTAVCDLAARLRPRFASAVALRALADRPLAPEKGKAERRETRGLRSPWAACAARWHLCERCRAPLRSGTRASRRSTCGTFRFRATLSRRGDQTPRPVSRLPAGGP